MIPGFIQLEALLASDDRNSTTWPSVDDIRSGRVSLSPTIRLELLRLIETGIFTLVEAPQAHRKTVTAKLLGHYLTEEDWTVWFAAAEHIEPGITPSALASLDGKKRLFIIDDCHRALELLTWLIPLLSAELRYARVLLLSRPVPSVSLASTGRPLEALRESGRCYELRVTETVIQDIILSSLRGRSSGKVADLFQRQVGADGVKHVEGIIGDDLEVLGAILDRWDPEAERLAEASLDALLSDIASSRLHSENRRNVLLRLSALYQFEIPVEAAFLGSGTQAMMREGVVLRSVSIRWPEAILCALAHASLARLYLQAAEKTRYIRDADSFVRDSAEQYLAWGCRNYYQVFRGLHFAGLQELIAELVARTPVQDSLLGLLRGSRESDLFAALGTASFVARSNSSFAGELFREYLQASDPSLIVDAVADLSPEALELCGLFLRRQGLAGLFVDTLATQKDDLVARKCGLPKLAALLLVSAPRSDLLAAILNSLSSESGPQILDSYPRGSKAFDTVLRRLTTGSEKKFAASLKRTLIELPNIGEAGGAEVAAYLRTYGRLRRGVPRIDWSALPNEAWPAEALLVVLRHIESTSSKKRVKEFLEWCGDPLGRMAAEPQEDEPRPTEVKVVRELAGILGLLGVEGSRRLVERWDRQRWEQLILNPSMLRSAVSRGRVSFLLWCLSNEAEALTILYDDRRQGGVFLALKHLRRVDLELAVYPRAVDGIRDAAFGEIATVSTLNRALEVAEFHSRVRQRLRASLTRSQLARLSVHAAANSRWHCRQLAKALQRLDRMNEPGDTGLVRRWLEIPESAPVLRRLSSADQAALLRESRDVESQVEKRGRPAVR